MAIGLAQVGNTRYQAPIFTHIPIDQKFDEEKHLQKFTQQEEIFDAYALFEFLATREYRRNTESQFFKRYKEYADSYALKVKSVRIFERCKLELGITDAFKLHDYGKSLALAEYAS